MGLIGGLGWIRRVGKKQCRSLCCRIRAEMKKAVRNRRSKQQVMNFQYDPHSYSLNFDDGFHQEMGVVERETRDFLRQSNIQVVGSCQERTAIWVYVVFAFGSEPNGI
ncbi:hypothetical protein OROGR_007090 [Orobanche gracilis]